MRRIRLVAAMLAVLGLSGCAAPLTPDDGAPSGSGPLVAFYGDSYTLGTGASDPAKRWSSIVSASRGWREFNPSVNGLGFVNNRPSGDTDDLPARIIAESPDIVLVTMGLNDTFSYDRAGDRIRTAIDDDLHRLRDALPAARIVVVEPFWYTDARPYSLGVITGWLREAASEIDADWIAGASRWLDGHHADAADPWMAADGLHPDDEGYRHLAEEMDAALSRLDPPL